MRRLVSFEVSATVALIALVGLARAQNPQTPKVPDGVKAMRNVEYVSGGHERQKLDLFLPEKADGPLPVIVWVHGGSWRQGSKDRCPALPLSAKGYAVASINYRLSQHAAFPAQIEDCKTSIRWLRANAKKFNLDGERIGVWGASAGGHLVALLGTTDGMKELEGSLGNADCSSKVQCVVDWFGPTDFRRLAALDANPNSVVAQLFGGPPKDHKDKVVLASPVAHVTKNCPPFLIMHGDKDPLVQFSQSEMLTEALKKANVEVTLVKLEGAGHGGAAFNTEDSRKRVEEFLAKHLKAKK